MEIKRYANWVFYLEGQPHFNIQKSGKWMYFFNDKERVSALCKKAVEQGIVVEAKHNDTEEGVACFYLNYDEIERHKKVIQFFLDNSMIKRTKNGDFSNISFKRDIQTIAGKYGKGFHSDIKLNQFIDLSTGKWLE